MFYKRVRAVCPNSERDVAYSTSSGATIVRGFELFGEEVGFRGRAEELAMLDKAWSDLRSDGCSAVVSVSGKEGVGKTRLAYEFAERVAKDGSARVIRVSAAANSAYASNGLAGQILRARFGLPHASDPEQARGKLRGALGEMLSSLGQMRKTQQKKMCV